MTTSIGPRPRRGLRGSARRIGALARAEALSLRRNPMALLTAVATPIVGVVVLIVLPPDGAVSPAGATIAVTAAAFALLFPLYYNLVAALVARREELVLKRLRSGECADPEILVGAAAPPVTIAGAYMIVGVVAAVATSGSGRPAGLALVVAAMVLGAVVFGLLAAVSTVLTRTVELAQLSTLPVVLISMILGGLVPPDGLPGPLPVIARVLPLTQVADLMWLGLTGSARGPADAAAGGIVTALLVLTAWVVVGVALLRRFMRWEPRG